MRKKSAFIFNRKACLSGHEKHRNFTPWATTENSETAFRQFFGDLNFLLPGVSRLLGQMGGGGGHHDVPITALLATGLFPSSNQQKCIVPERKAVSSRRVSKLLVN